MSKKNQPKQAEKVIVNFQADAQERDQAALAVRRLGYLTLSQYLREKMREAVKKSPTQQNAA